MAVVINESEREYVQLDVFYGTLRPCQDYQVLEEGYDWLLLTAQGKCVYVPKCLISTKGFTDVEESESESMY